MNNQSRRRSLAFAILLSLLVNAFAYLIGIVYNHISQSIPAPNPYLIGGLSFPLLVMIFFLFLSYYREYISRFSLMTGIPHKIGSEENKSGNDNIKDNVKGGEIYGNKP